MWYYRNARLTLHDGWGPPALAAAEHANKAFASVHHYADLKARKPIDSSSGLRATKEELEGPGSSVVLPVLKTTSAAPASQKQKEVHRADMSEAEGAARVVKEEAVRAAKQLATQKAEAAETTALATAEPAVGTIGVQEVLRRGRNGKGKGGKGGRGQGARERTTDHSSGKQPKGSSRHKARHGAGQDRKQLAGASSLEILSTL